MSRVGNLYLLIVSLVLIVGFPLVLFSAPVLGGSVGCVPPGAGDWILNGSNTTICDNVNLTINGNISIYYNTSLIINNSNISTTQYILLYDNSSFNLYNSNFTTISSTTLNDNSTFYSFNSTMKIYINAWNTSKISYTQSIITIGEIGAYEKTDIIINNSDINSDLSIFDNVTTILISSNISMLGIEPAANSQTNLTGIIQNTLITKDIKPSYSDFLINISNTNITLFRFIALSNTTNIIRDSVMDIIEVKGDTLSNTSIINVSFNSLYANSYSMATVINSTYATEMRLSTDSYIEFKNLSYSGYPWIWIRYNSIVNFSTPSTINSIDYIGYGPGNFTMKMHGLVTITNKSVNTFGSNNNLTRYYPTYIYNSSNELENTKRIIIVDNNLTVYFNTTTDAVGYIELNFTWNSTNYNNTYYITDDTYHHYGNLTITADTPINLSSSVNANCHPKVSGNWIINETQNVICVNRTLALNGNLIVYGNANFTLNNTIISAGSNSYSMKFYGNSKILLADVNSSMKGNFSGNAVVELKNTVISNDVDISGNSVLRLKNNNTITGFGLVGNSESASEIYIEGNATFNADSPVSINSATTNVTRLFNFFVYNISLMPYENINLSIWNETAMLWNGTTNVGGYVQANFTFITSMLSQKFSLFKNGTWQDYIYLAHDTPINITGMPPEISNYSPVNLTQYAYSTTKVSVEINTTASSLCRYSATADFPYSNGINFTNTGDTTHRHNFTVSAGNAYSYYYKCLNSNGITRYQLYHRFSIDSAPADDDPPSGGGTTGSTPRSYPVTAAGATGAAVNFLYENLRADQKINITPKSESLAFTQFSARITENIEGITNIVIKGLAGKPVEIATAPSIADLGRTAGVAIVYQYIRLDHLNLEDTKIDDITIEFKVPKTWILNNSADEKQLYLMRFADGKWNRLTTIVVSSDASYVNYKSISPGLSVFAIAAETKIPKMQDGLLQEENQSATNSSLTDAQPDNNSMHTDDNIMQTSGTENQDPATQEISTTSGSNSFVLPLMIVLVLLASGSGFFYYYKKKLGAKSDEFKIGGDKVKYDTSILGILEKKSKEKKEAITISDEVSENIDIRTIACKELILYYEDGMPIESSMTRIISEGYPELDARNAYTDLKNIIKYIKAGLGKGFSSESIRQKLVSSGFAKLDKEIGYLIIHIKMDINSIENMDSPISPSIPYDPTYEILCKEVLFYIEEKENIPEIVTILTNKGYPTDLVNVALIDIEKIGEYIQTQLGRGYKPDIIKQKLMISGWQMEEAIIDTIEKMFLNR